MLERLSMSSHNGGSTQKQSKIKSLSSFGKKATTFHVVISEPRAELMAAKQHTPGHPCVLMWVRGDTIHVTEDSTGVSVLSWSDTYFSQLVNLVPSSGGGFRPKECKFKVQQKGKTIAKSAVVDLAKYCSDAGLAREQSVKLPLTPSGTLYFVVSTMPSAEQRSAPSSASLADGRSSHGQSNHGRNRTSNNGGGPLATTSTGIAAAASAASLPSSAIATPVPPAARSSSVFGLGSSQENVAAALAGSMGAAPTPSEDGDRPSTSSRLQKKHRLQHSASVGKPFAESDGSGFFRRIARVGSLGSRGGFAGPGVASSASVTVAPSSTPPLPPLRKFDSADLGGSPTGAAAAAARGQAGSNGGSPVGAAVSAIKSTAAGSGGGSSVSGVAGVYSPTRMGPQRSTCNGSLMPAASAPQCSGGGGESLRRSLARHSAAAASTSSSSSDVAAAAAGAAASPRRTEGAAGGGGNGSGWGAWLRGGLGWGRSSNHSATGTSTTRTHSQASLHGPGGAAGVEHDSSGLEAAIMEATEPGELRDLALDMLHERDEWRSRALSAQDALGRAQAAKGSAVREAQRLEVRLREYQDELGRRTDGSLLQELVEAKVRIAELANENLRLRRQITHMGPLFYDDSSDEGAGVANG